VTRVLIADDDDLMRAGLVELLAAALRSRSSARQRPDAKPSSKPASWYPTSC
jgi:DNA-binding NarL/FixJ family response regulator